MEKLKSSSPGERAAAARTLVPLHPSLSTFPNEFQESLNAFLNGNTACVLHSHLHNKASHLAAGSHGLLCELETKAEKEPF